MSALTEDGSAAQMAESPPEAAAVEAPETVEAKAATAPAPVYRQHKPKKGGRRRKTTRTRGATSRPAKRDVMRIEPPKAKKKPAGSAKRPAQESKPRKKSKQPASPPPPTDSQTQFLPQSVILEEAGTPRLVHTTIMAVTLLIAALIGWSAITEIEEVAVGTGEVLPTGRVQVVQHLEGGIVSEILIDEGDPVKKGQILIRLDPTGALAELAQIRARQAALTLQAARLQAFADGNFLASGRRDKSRFEDLADDQRAILLVQERTWLSQRTVIDQQVKQKQAEFERLRSQRESLARQVAIVREGFVMRKRLFESGATSRVDFLEAKRELERTTGDLAGVVASMRETSEGLAESRSRLDELDARLRSESLEERGKVTAELAEVREKLVQIEVRVKRLEIRAGANGIVKGLMVNSIGGVVAPGEVLMEIVPSDLELIVEAQISTRDIGHVEVGQPVKIKIDTYDFSRYGAIAGTLTKISATTFQDEEGRPYYKGTITLKQNYVGQVEGRNPVLSGMTVQAEVITGSKSVMAYLLKPIYVAANQAFHER